MAGKHTANKWTPRYLSCTALWPRCHVSYSCPTIKCIQTGRLVTLSNLKTYIHIFLSHFMPVDLFLSHTLGLEWNGKVKITNSGTCGGGGQALSSRLILHLIGCYLAQRLADAAVVQIKIKSHRSCQTSQGTDGTKNVQIFYSSAIHFIKQLGKLISDPKMSIMSLSHLQILRKWSSVFSFWFSPWETETVELVPVWPAETPDWKHVECVSVDSSSCLLHVSPTSACPCACLCSSWMSDAALSSWLQTEEIWQYLLMKEKKII